LVSYLLLFLTFLIRDLDNPFGYYEHTSSEDVSLKPWRTPWLICRPGSQMNGWGSLP